MPSGHVRWYDPRKGYGFITGDDGSDVFLPGVELPKDVVSLKRGEKIDYSVVEGRKGPQAMNVIVHGPRPSLVAATRPSPDDMAVIVGDLMTLLQSAADELRRHHYPSPYEARKLARMLRAIADDFDVEE